MEPGPPRDPALRELEREARALLEFAERLRGAPWSDPIADALERIARNALEYTRAGV